ncbi:acyl-coenzyme A synthetase ACSM3, mitochondrial-like isoform X2 [Anneissia japonica]|uniref:acyl-coenzyme A synthetase ACSM3, mitochondrial-like isoform X2 n=1 Tax=Anneissia japonica TaxID=1529436 RepID=UPI0014258D00|nr:acyl-coenzyme A synthetase ACSM3, mitochondrial-like isoform X2 [Anneissia japonica]
MLRICTKNILERHPVIISLHNGIFFKQCGVISTCLKNTAKTHCAIYQLPRLNKFLQSHQPIRSFLTAVSATGFNDYELGLKHFQLEVPEYFNFVQVLDEWANKEKTGERRTKNPALWWIDDHGDEIKWTFQDVQVKAKKVANILDKVCQVRKGEVVMLILPRVPEWWLFNVACLRTGTVLCPGTTLLRAKDIKRRLLDSKATCIISDESVAPFVDQVTDECPDLKSKLFVSQSNEPRNGWLDFRSLYEEASEEHECVMSKSSDPTLIYFTSGTTGLPKMVEHTQASYGLAHVITGKYWLDLTSIDIHWNLSDTGWAKSAYSSFYAPWIQGSCIFVHDTPKFDAIKMLQILDEYPVSTLCGAPTVFRMLVQEDLSQYNLDSLRHVVSAGEPLNPEIIEEWRKRVGHVIREGYGQTETVILCGSFRCLPLKPGSMGKAAPGYDLCIVDDDGNDLGTGQEGCVGVRVKPNRPVGLFTDYINDPERTASVFKGDFYLTGDRALKDEDGYFWFVARDDDVITSAGIGPFEVESALIEHPAVAESAAVSSPDELRGEVVKAFVVLASNYKVENYEALKEELKKYVQDTTAPYKYPRKAAGLGAQGIALSAAGGAVQRGQENQEKKKEKYKEEQEQKPKQEEKKEDKKKKKKSMDLLGGALVAVTAVTVGPYLLGFTGAGIAAGSIAAKLMSAVAVYNGGGVAAGSTVAVLQSVGAAGLSAQGIGLSTTGGAAVARGANILLQKFRGGGKEEKKGVKVGDVEKEEIKVEIDEVEIEFVESLPKTVSAKIRRVELRNKEWAKYSQNND